MSTIYDTSVLITGGAGELGRLLAEKSLTAGASRIILWDVNREGLEEAKRELVDISSPEVRIHTQQVDLTRKNEIYSRAEQLVEEQGPVDLLFNNAGVVAGKMFHQYTRDEIEWIIRVNTLGVMHTTLAFLPYMLEHNSGHIINIASAIGLMANTQMSAYVASKWAVSGWSESLRLELKMMNRDIRVTTVQPGYIRTKMFAGAKAPLLTPILEPEFITDKIIQAVIRNKPFVREPLMVKLIPLLRGVLPNNLFNLLAGKLFGVHRSMEQFKGRRDQAPSVFDSKAVEEDDVQ